MLKYLSWYIEVGGYTIGILSWEWLRHIDTHFSTFGNMFFEGSQYYKEMETRYITPNDKFWNFARIDKW